jgi:hypothetical protein
LFFLQIHYRTKAVMYHSISKVTNSITHNCESYAVLCFCCDNPSRAESIAWHRVVGGVCFLRADAKLLIYDNLLSNSDTACTSLSLYRQLKMTDFVSCSLRLVFSHTDTLHQPDEVGKREVKNDQAIIQFFHTHQGVFI